MSIRVKSEIEPTAGPETREGPASALRKHVDLSLVAESVSSKDGRAHSKSTVAHSKSTVGHSKSTTDGQVLPELSSEERQRALRLAERLASSHSD